MTELISKRFSIERTKRLEEEYKLKLKLAEQEIRELKDTLRVVEGSLKEEQGMNVSTKEKFHNYEDQIGEL